MYTKFRELIRLLRPHQWIKNIFVFAGITFGHLWTSIPLLKQATLTCLAFILLSSAIYVGNDILDRQTDALHPKKKNRPLAIGSISIFTAAILAIILVISSLILASFVATKVIWILLAYVVLNTGYSMRLKYIIYLDILCIACGFLLRVLAGTYGIGIKPSIWLLVCSLMLTLFLGFSKRYSEQKITPSLKNSTATLAAHYPPATVYTLTLGSAIATIMSYSFYTLHQDSLNQANYPLTLTIPIVSYGIFRYFRRLRATTNNYYGIDMARDLFTDSHLLLTSLLWVIVMVIISRPIHVSELALVQQPLIMSKHLLVTAYNSLFPSSNPGVNI